jgi:imidazole glycerol-phosphate synthase subunit HisH
MPSPIGIIDIGISNLGSIVQSLRVIGRDVVVISDPAIPAGIDRIVLPGVGAFSAAVKKLHASHLADKITQAAASGMPILGICLGMQLLCTRSLEFGEHNGLDLVPGDVKRLDPKLLGIRVPNMGWHKVSPDNQSRLLTGEPQFFYHLHSFFTTPSNDTDRAGYITLNGHKITVAVERQNVFGVQFHPEKSQDYGLDLLDRFCNL